MARFMLTYRGPATPPDQITPEQGQAILQQWNLWTEKVGPAIVQLGDPFGASASVAADGSAGQPPQLNGFTIVEAGSLDEAKAFCDGHPFLSSGEPEFLVDIYELIAVPGM